MKKKIILFGLCSIILFGVCGCGNDSDSSSIVGKYLDDNGTEELTLYEDGTCYWYYYYSGIGYIEHNKYECSYDYINGKIEISTTNEFVNNRETCSYNNGTIDCGDNRIYSK